MREIKNWFLASLLAFLFVGVGGMVLPYNMRVTIIVPLVTALFVVCVLVGVFVFIFGGD